MLKDLKKKLENREKIFATTVFYVGWSGIVQIFTNDVLDFLIFDLEHGRFSTEEVEEMIRMCNVQKLPAIARVPDKEYVFMSKVLDMGADGILVPRMETREEALQVVDCTRFPPKGRKGCGGYSLLHGLDSIDQFNSSKLLFLQIESPTGIENLSSMIDVGEFSGIIVGPTDLSIAMGIPLQFQNPLLIDAVKEIVSICRSKEMSCGIFCDSIKDIEFWRKAGMNIIWSGGDIVYIIQAYNELCRVISSLE